ncbi:hypothetical protein [Providencia huaxiensis]|uniref:hypothetical protein n=1 Tax=Providencia huaxiensis TaxID=2027290 RepID=UPI0034E3AE92
MENEIFANINQNLDLVKLKIKRINELLNDVDNSANKSIERMDSVREDLLVSKRRDADKINSTMNTVEIKINESLSEQYEKVKQVSNMLLKQESALTNLKEEDWQYSRLEADIYIKEVNQDLQNNESWNRPENNFKKIDFVNHGGLRGKIFTPISSFNIKSNELAKEIYEVEMLMKVMNRERLNIELDFLKGMKTPKSSLTQRQQPDTLAEQIVGFKPAYESNASSSIDAPILDQKPIIQIKGCVGRTAMCGVTH